MIYRFKDKVIEWDGKAKVYSGGWLVFKGCGFIGILTFIKLCDHHPDVVEKFKPQLEQREKTRFKEAKPNDNELSG